MELSTSIPMPRARPARDIMFRVMPLKYIINAATNTLNGMEKATTKVGFTSFRNTARTMIARAAPMTILFKILLINWTMNLP